MIAETGCGVCTTKARIPGSGARRYSEMVSLQALQEDGVKVFVVRLLVEAKGADVDNKFGEDRG